MCGVDSWNEDLIVGVLFVFQLQLVAAQLLLQILAFSLLLHRLLTQSQNLLDVLNPAWSALDAVLYLVYVVAVQLQLHLSRLLDF